MFLQLRDREINMKSLFCLGLLLCVASAFADDRIDCSAFGFRRLWMTNAVAASCKIRSLLRSIDSSHPEVAAKWFAEVMECYPDVSNTNQVLSSLREKRVILRDCSRLASVVSDTNAWLATASFFARVRAARKVAVNRREELMRILRKGDHVDELASWRKSDLKRRLIRNELELAEKDSGAVLTDVFVKQGILSIPVVERAQMISNICHKAVMTKEETALVVRGNGIPMQKKWSPQDDSSWRQLDGIWIGPATDNVE